MKLPEVYVAEFRGGKLLPEVRALGWGRMWVLLQPNPLPEELWAFDNGAFRDWTAGNSFNGPAYRKRLERAHSITPPPRLAVVPDVVAGGMQSLVFSMDWLRDLPDDWPWYLAVQDGMTEEAVEAVLPRFAGLFLGGTNRFKTTAPVWCRLAHQYGKRFHYGRAGTIRKLNDAYLIGADSLDSAFPLWTKARWREFVQAWQTLQSRHGTPQPLDAFVNGRNEQP